MHSKKASSIIGLIVLILDLFLMAVYLQRQGEHTFGFVKSLYEEIKAYRKGRDKQAESSKSARCLLTSDHALRDYFVAWRRQRRSHYI
jgi:hypothetical protein